MALFCLSLHNALRRGCLTPNLHSTPAPGPLLAHPLASDSLPRSRPPPAVRFRQNCLYDGPASFSPGGLPSALDDFLSTYEKPAVLLINIV